MTNAPVSQIRAVVRGCTAREATELGRGRGHGGKNRSPADVGTSFVRHPSLLFTYRLTGARAQFVMINPLLFSKGTRGLINGHKRTKDNGNKKTYFGRGEFVWRR